MTLKIFWFFSIWKTMWECHMRSVNNLLSSRGVLQEKSSSLHAAGVQVFQRNAHPVLTKACIFHAKLINNFLTLNLCCSVNVFLAVKKHLIALLQERFLLCLQTKICFSGWCRETNKTIVSSNKRASRNMRPLYWSLVCFHLPILFSSSFISLVSKPAFAPCQTTTTTCIKLCVKQQLKLFCLPKESWNPTLSSFQRS